MGLATVLKRIAIAISIYMRIPIIFSLNIRVNHDFRFNNFDVFDKEKKLRLYLWRELDGSKYYNVLGSWSSLVFRQRILRENNIIIIY